MKSISYCLMTLFFTAVAWSATTQTLECVNLSETSVAMNSFNLTGPVEIKDNGTATAQLTGTNRRAGINSIVSETTVLNLTGTSRVYPAKTLGFYEVVLLQLKGELRTGLKTVQLTVASGLTGPQSTLAIQGIPFRAECKLK